MLTGYVVEQLLRIEPAMPVVPLEEDTPLDALIATGSDSTRSYFGKRYREMPSLLRGSRYILPYWTEPKRKRSWKDFRTTFSNISVWGAAMSAGFLFLAVYDPTLLRDALSRYPDVASGLP